jgi:hypothetical protein
MLGEPLLRTLSPPTRRVLSIRKLRPPIQQRVEVVRQYSLDPFSIERQWRSKEPARAVARGLANLQLEQERVGNSFKCPSSLLRIHHCGRLQLTDES